MSGTVVDDMSRTIGAQGRSKMARQEGKDGGGVEMDKDGSSDGMEGCCRMPAKLTDRSRSLHSLAPFSDGQ